MTAMTDNNPTEAHPPAESDEAQQDVAQASDAKAEAAGTASDELSEDDLEAVAGGVTKTKGVPSGGGANAPIPVVIIMQTPIE